MTIRVRIVPAILGCLLAAAPAIAQTSSQLAVGPDAGGYLCPDGRQLYVKSCYDNSPNASCGVILMHLPLQGRYQQERSQTRSEITPSVAACKVYPLEFRNDGTVVLAPPKSAPPQQTAKAPAAVPAPKTSTAAIPPTASDKITIVDGIAIGSDGVRSSLVRISPADAKSQVAYVDDASRKASAQKDIVTIWSLRAYVDGAPPVAGASAVWIKYLVNCKQSSFQVTEAIWLDRLTNILKASPIDLRGDLKEGTVDEAAGFIACNSAQRYGGPRFASAAAAIVDAVAGAAPKTVAKPAAPVAKPAAVAPPAKAKTRLPETELEKKFFQAVQANQLQAAINAFIASPEDKRVPVAELADKQGMTALHWAAANRNAAATRWLLGKKSQVDLADEKGRTPLKIALDNKDTQVMTVLLNIGGADARFALPGHDEELKGFKKTSELVEFMIKTAAPAKN